MSSGDESAQELSSDNDTPRPSPPSSRPQSRTPGTPRKRRRLESVEPLRVRRYDLEGRYNDAYRVLFNDDVSRAVARCDPLESRQHYTTQYGASTWSAEEHAALFAALARLGKDDVAGIAQAVGTKTLPETRELLLLLADAASKKGDMGLKLRHVPAAVELGEACTEELDVMAEALAWYQEQWEVAEEQQRYGDHWLISPPVAADIEHAINGPSRAPSSPPPTPAAPGTPRTGPGVAGSCVRCKHHKIRCDRKVPCTNCARLKKKVVCEYKPSKRTPLAVHLTNQTADSDTAEEQIPQPASPVEPRILQAIPQASLLHAENMLSLSKDVFMNRSPDIPSPWPHWSAYASDQVPEPSMMRTAFNDFHTLAVSVTKRLMQTAIIQATSRLRSQRRRTKKGVMPFVKTRDVLSAIDVLGLKRNGRSRWTGVARRCNLRVFDEQRTTRFRIKRREISWDQAENILGLYDAVTTQPASGVDSAASASELDDEDVFKRRAARHGTPLPMEHLSLSNSDSSVDMEDSAAESDVASSDDLKEEFANPEKQGSTDRFMSAESQEPSQDYTHEKQTLEQFDQEASRQEEEALCKLLGITTVVKTKSSDPGEVKDDAEDETLFTNADDWRQWTDYHAAWEEYQTPVPNAKFIANQKPRTAPIAVHASVDSDTSSAASQSPRQSKMKRDEAVELQPQNPRAYAAMQSFAYDPHDDAPQSDLSGSDDDAGADVPAQSIEDTGNPQHADAMDWET